MWPARWLLGASSLKLNRRRTEVRYLATRMDTADAFLAGLVNYEQRGIPAGAGLAAPEGAFDLGRMHRLLKALGDPHQSWPAIHIAGSKGKGSTAALLSQALRAGGYRVGCYTSPHMHHLGERIAVGGVPLGPAQLDSLVAAHSGALTETQEAEAGALTHFEVVTALAFKHFAEAAVDVAVVETGMGGTTDATNVFRGDRLALSVITALGYEHVEALGGSIESIARAKAGIMKAGRPVVVARQQHDKALRELKAAAAEKGCPLVMADQQVHVAHVGYRLTDAPSSSVLREQVCITTAKPATSGQVADGGVLLPPTELQMSLVGPAQHANVEVALAACMQLQGQGWRLDHEAMCAGLQRAHLPGRMQVLRLDPPTSDAKVGDNTGPVATQQPAAGPQLLVLDGAHSPESAANLTRTLREAFPHTPVALVVAMAADKEHRAVLTELRALNPSVVVFTSVQIAGSNQRAAAPGLLAAQWEAAAMLAAPARAGAVRCRQLIQASLQAAVERAKEEVRSAAVQQQAGNSGNATSQGLQPASIVVVTGSLHAVAGAQRLEEVAGLLARASHNEQ